MFSTLDLPLPPPHLQSLFSLFNAAPMDQEASLNLFALQTLMNLQQLQHQLPLHPYHLPTFEVPAAMKQLNTLEILAELTKASATPPNPRKRSFPVQQPACLLQLSGSSNAPGVTREMFDEALQRILDEEIVEDRSSSTDSERESLSSGSSAFRKISRLSPLQQELEIDEPQKQQNSLVWKGNLLLDSEVEIPMECHFIDGGRQLTKEDFSRQLNTPRVSLSTAQSSESQAKAASELSGASDHGVCLFLPVGETTSEKAENADLLKAKLASTVGTIELASKDTSLFVFPSGCESELTQMIEKSSVFSISSDLLYFPGVLAKK